MKKMEAIPDIEMSPFPSIARLETKRATFGYGKHFHGTGSVINKRFILTAAHNIYHKKFLSSFKHAYIALGYNNGQAIRTLEKRYRLNSTRVAHGFDYKIFSRDFGIIDLGIELSSPHISFRLPEENEVKELVMEGVNLQFAGYPGEHHGGKTLKGASCNSLEYKYDGVFLTYQIDTATGNSGGPVWFEKDDEYIIVGVHVKESAAVAINTKILKDIKSWMSN